MQFDIRLINRREMPHQTLLICEDDIKHQRELMERAEKLFPPQGKIQVALVPSSIMAATIISQGFKDQVRCIILDHDMPYGHATNLLQWMDEAGIKHIPVVTASGIPQNNKHMKNLCDSLGIECHEYDKFEVIGGEADGVIRGYFEE